jgi:hypothetical protein
MPLGVEGLAAERAGRAAGGDHFESSLGESECLLGPQLVSYHVGVLVFLFFDRFGFHLL